MSEDTQSASVQDASSAAASPSPATAAASHSPRSANTTAAVTSPTPVVHSLPPSGGGNPDVPDSIPSATAFDDSLLRPLHQGVGEEILLPFIEEYAKLQSALTKSHESEQRFVNKCKTLLKQTRAHSHKITALQAIQAQDSKRKAALLAEIDKAKLMLSKLDEEMRDKKESVKTLRNELSTLGHELEESSNEVLRDQRNTINKLEVEIQKYTTIRDKDRSGLTKLRQSNVEHFKALQDLLAALSRSQQEFDGLESKLLEAKALSGKELRRKAELEKHMKEVQLRVTELQGQLNGKKELITKALRELQEVQAQLTKSDKVVEAHRIQYEELNEEARVANERLLELQDTNEQLDQAFKKAQRELDEEKLAMKNAKHSSESKMKSLESMRQRVQQLAEETRIEEDAKTEAQSKLKLLKEQISALQFKLNANAKAMDTCVREREVLAQSHMSKLDSIRAKEAALKIKTSTLKNIKNEHQGYLVSIRQLSKVLEDLKRDKAAHELDLQRRLVQKARALEEVSQREVQISEYQQQIVVNEGKLRQQQNLLEAVRSDRNMYRKTLIEQQAEMHDYKRKFHFLSTAVSQSKSEIEDKNQFIVFEHFNLQNVRDDIENLERNNRTTFGNLEKTEEKLKDQSKQIRQLSTIISDADEELRVQVKQYNAIVNEQRVLNQQLVKRNDELATLYEQLKLQNSVLAKSAAHYKEKQLLLADLEMESTLLRATLEEVLQDTAKYSTLQESIRTVEDALVDERLKIKALSDELQKPINIHRWRRLMDTNTETYAMISKVRGLQRQLISTSNEVEKKEQEIVSKEKLYIELRKVVAKNPGSEAGEQLRAYLEQLEEKKSKLKTMKNELKLYQNKVKEFQYATSKMEQDLKLIKLAYFQKRRRQQQQQQREGQGMAQEQGAFIGGDLSGRGGSGGGEGNGKDEELPDILKPTQFPTYTPPPDADAAVASSSSSSHQRQQSSSSSSTQDFSQLHMNPYLFSSSSTRSSGAGAPAAAAAGSSSSAFAASSSSSYFPPASSLADDDSDDDDADVGSFRALARETDDIRVEEVESRPSSRAIRTGTNTNTTTEEKEESKQSYSSSSSSVVAASASSSSSSSVTTSHRPSSAIRPGSASRQARPPSARQQPSASPTASSSSSAASRPSTANRPRSGAQRPTSSSSSSQAERGEAGYSRFPSINGQHQ